MEELIKTFGSIMSAKMPGDAAEDVMLNRWEVEKAAKARNFQSLLANLKSDGSKYQNGKTQDDNDQDVEFDLFTEDGGLLSTKDHVDTGLPEGLFSGSKPRSNDTLLEQLLGKKAANAHRKSQKQQDKEVNESCHTAPKPTNTLAKRKIEDDDSGDEGGRAAAIQSKSAKKSKAPPQLEAIPVKVTENAEVIADDEPEQNAIAEAAPPKPPQRAANAKPASFLDELLSKKSKKRKKKAGANSTGND